MIKTLENSTNVTTCVIEQVDVSLHPIQTLNGFNMLYIAFSYYTYSFIQCSHYKESLLCWFCHVTVTGSELKWLQ